MERLKQPLKYSLYDSVVFYFASCCLATNKNRWKWTTKYFRVVNMVTENGFQMLLLILVIYFIFSHLLIIHMSLPSLSVKTRQCKKWKLNQKFIIFQSPQNVGVVDKYEYEQYILQSILKTLKQTKYVWKNRISHPYDVAMVTKDTDFLKIPNMFSLSTDILKYTERLKKPHTTC